MFLYKQTMPKESFLKKSLTLRPNQKQVKKVEQDYHYQIVLKK